MSIKTLLYILLIQYFFNYPEALRMYMHHVPFSNRELLQRDIKNIIKFSIGSSFLCFKPILQSVSAIESNILATRFYGKGIDKYNPGLTSNDIYYPKWFEGKWNCNSTCVDIAAPLGNLSFGGSRAYERALLELNTSLIYNAKFRQEGQGRIVNDRLYNVEQIAIASMGENSIMDDLQPDNDLAKRVHLLLKPQSSNGITFEVDLYSTDRIQEQLTADTFHVMEKSTQVIFVNYEVPTPSVPLRKEIETITLYRLLDNGRISALQRTATFLSSLDPRYAVIAAAEPRVTTNAVDIRCYQLLYNKLN